MFLVDNLVSSFGSQLSQGIPIQPFDGNMEDRELIALRDYLLRLISLPEGTLSQANLAVFGLENIRLCKESTQYIEQMQASAGLTKWARKERLGGGEET